MLGAGFNFKAISMGNNKFAEHANCVLRTGVVVVAGFSMGLGEAGSHVHQKGPVFPSRPFGMQAIVTTTSTATGTGTR